MKEIKLTDTVYDINQRYPEVIDLLFNFGFNQIRWPNMIQTAGRLLTLEKGCMLKGLDFEKLKAMLLEFGYKLVA